MEKNFLKPFGLNCFQSSRLYFSIIMLSSPLPILPKTQNMVSWGAEEKPGDLRIITTFYGTSLRAFLLAHCSKFNGILNTLNIKRSVYTEQQHLTWLIYCW